MTIFMPIGPPPTDEGARRPPYDGDEVLAAVSVACVVIVRNAWWDDGSYWDEKGHESQEEARGWWSYRHSVSQDKLEGIYEPTHWAPMPEIPDDLS